MPRLSCCNEILPIVVHWCRLQVNKILSYDSMYILRSRKNTQCEIIFTTIRNSWVHHPDEVFPHFAYWIHTIITVPRPRRSNKCYPRDRTHLSSRGMYHTINNWLAIITRSLSLLHSSATSQLEILPLRPVNKTSSWWGPALYNYWHTQCLKAYHQHGIRLDPCLRKSLKYDRGSFLWVSLESCACSKKPDIIGSGKSIHLSMIGCDATTFSIVDNRGCAWLLDHEIMSEMKVCLELFPEAQDSEARRNG